MCTCKFLENNKIFDRSACIINIFSCHLCSVLIKNRTTVKQGDSDSEVIIRFGTKLKLSENPTVTY